MRCFYISVLISGLCFTLSAQSKTVLDFEKNTKGQKLFLYQSLIRVFNQEKNPEFNLLIRDLDHIRFILSDSTGADAKTSFNNVDEGIQSEGFEEILRVDSKEYQCHVYELETKKGKSSWIATFFMDGRSGLIEMKGSLNMKYLRALGSFNWEDLSDIMPNMVANPQKEEIIIKTD